MSIGLKMKRDLRDLKREDLDGWGWRGMMSRSRRERWKSVLMVITNERVGRSRACEREAAASEIAELVRIGQGEGQIFDSSWRASSTPYSNRLGSISETRK